MYLVKDGSNTVYRTVVINNKCDTKIEEYVRKQRDGNPYLEKVAETASMYYFDAKEWLRTKGYLKLIPVNSWIFIFVPEDGVKEIYE